jgi:hypothetical protein
MYSVEMRGFVDAGEPDELKSISGGSFLALGEPPYINNIGSESMQWAALVQIRPRANSVNR